MRIGLSQQTLLLWWITFAASPVVAFHIPAFSSSSRQQRRHTILLRMAAPQDPWSPPVNWTFRGIRRRNPSPTLRQSYGADGVIMPDGGLNPCIIKVIGVGGGGCNAVSMLCNG
jgi:cell division protein FtsZ